MEKNNKVASVLTDLVRINNDRIVGYEKAIDELKPEDEDLKMLFRRYTTESRQLVTELNSELSKLGAAPVEGTTHSGKIYRVWMDLKTAISGKTREAVLENCVFGEDAAQKAYDMALNTDADLEPEQREMIVQQKLTLRMGHDEVKRLRDLHKVGS